MCDKNRLRGLLTTTSRDQVWHDLGDNSRLTNPTPHHKMSAKLKFLLRSSSPSRPFHQTQPKQQSTKCCTQQAGATTVRHSNQGWDSKHLMTDSNKMSNNATTATTDECHAYKLSNRTPRSAIKNKTTTTKPARQQVRGWVDIRPHRNEQWCSPGAGDIH